MAFKVGDLVVLKTGELQGAVRRTYRATTGDESKRDRILVQWVPDGEDEPTGSSQWQFAADFRLVE